MRPILKRIAEDPQLAPEAVSLAVHFERDENWRDWCAVLAEFGARVFEGERLESLLVRAAGLNEAVRNNPSAALGFWLKAFSLSGNDERCGPVVERIASDNESWSQAVAAWVAFDGDSGVGRVTRLLRLGRWLMGPCDDPQRAKRFFGDALMSDPRNRESLLSLVALNEDEPVHQLGYLERLIAQGDTEQQVRLWRQRCGDIYLKHLQDYKNAARHLRLALQYEDQSSTSISIMRQLAEVHRKADDSEGALGVLARLCAVAPETEHANIFQEMAQHSERVGRIDEAIALWQKAAVLAEQESHVSIALERLCREHGRWGTLIDTLQQRLQTIRTASGAHSCSDCKNVDESH